MQIFVQVMLPVILIFLLGYVVQCWKRIDLRAISTLVIYILTPSLVFRTFYITELNNQYLMIVVFSLILFFILVGLNMLYNRLRKYSQSVESGLVLSVGFMNGGNYGAPVLLFAYGEVAFAYAISILVIHAIMMNFFGGFYANRSKGGIRSAFLAVLKLPAIYAAVLALSLQTFNLQMPANFFAAVDLVASAAIPVVMLILGMQLAEMKLKALDWDKISYGTAVRLFISPAIAYVLVHFLPIEPLLQKTLIVTAAMPSAAMAVIFAIQFDAEPKLVSSITFISTLLSIVTVTALLVLLG
jgi:predicted permease